MKGKRLNALKLDFTPPAEIYGAEMFYPPV